VGQNARILTSSSNMVLVALTAFVISLACLLGLLSTLGSRLALDRPNERSLHSSPVPRTGGLGIAAGVGGSIILSTEIGVWAPVFVALFLVVCSFADDVFKLSPLVRLLIHLAAAGTAVTMMGFHTQPLLFALLLIGIAWATNLFNFMDGSDGLAGGMTVIGFGTYALAAHLEGVAWLASLCMIITSASFAFLLLNFAPAKIFMGDSGSIPLGFLAGTIGVAGWQLDIWQLWFPALLFSPFVVDATLTLLKRFARKEKFWLAHREHYYQKLVRMGIGHRKTAIGEYVLMVGCATSALLARKSDPYAQAACLGFFATTYLLLAFLIDARWSRHKVRTSQ
jgi:UDP-GlcNAc:undecaprenyl-phosphate/decaprenyl-phosphate GlcNAc-1-phosphate transferase